MMRTITSISCIAILLLNCNIALSQGKEGEIKHDREPWDCIPYLLRAAEYLQYPTKILRDTWSTLTAPKSVKDYNPDEFEKAKERYKADGDTNPSALPDTFEEKLAFIEVYSEKNKILPLNLGELIQSGNPTAKKAVGKLMSGINIKDGMTEAQIFKLLVSLYKIEYRAPSRFWSEDAISKALTKRVQVELMSNGIEARLKLTKSLKEPTTTEKIAASKGFKIVLTTLLNVTALKTFVPVYLPELKKIRISDELLNAIEKDGLDAHLDKLKELYGNKIKWGQFYEKIRPTYMLAAGAYTAVYAYSYLQQYMLGQSQREHPPKEGAIVEITLKILGLKP